MGEEGNGPRGCKTSILFVQYCITQTGFWQNAEMARPKEPGDVLLVDLNIFVSAYLIGLSSKMLSIYVVLNGANLNLNKIVFLLDIKVK